MLLDPKKVHWPISHHMSALQLLHSVTYAEARQGLAMSEFDLFCQVIEAVGNIYIYI